MAGSGFGAFLEGGGFEKAHFLWKPGAGRGRGPGTLSSIFSSLLGHSFDDDFIFLSFSGHSTISSASFGSITSFIGDGDGDWGFSFRKEGGRDIVPVIPSPETFCVISLSSDILFFTLFDDICLPI